MINYASSYLSFTFDNNIFLSNSKLVFNLIISREFSCSASMLIMSLEISMQKSWEDNHIYMEKPFLGNLYKLEAKLDQKATIQPGKQTDLFMSVI